MPIIACLGCRCFFRRISCWLFCILFILFILFNFCIYFSVPSLKVLSFALCQIVLSKKSPFLLFSLAPRASPNFFARLFVHATLLQLTAQTRTLYYLFNTFYQNGRY